MEVKSVRTVLVILIKVATPPLPLQTKFIWRKMGANECFFWPQHCWCVCLWGVGGGGEGGLKRWDEPKADKKMPLGVESYVTITWKGVFSQFQVLLSSIVELTYCLEWRFAFKVV